MLIGGGYGAVYQMLPIITNETPTLMRMTYYTQCNTEAKPSSFRILLGRMNYQIWRKIRVESSLWIRKSWRRSGKRWWRKLRGRSCKCWGRRSKWRNLKIRINLVFKLNFRGNFKLKRKICTKDSKCYKLNIGNKSKGKSDKSFN